MKPGAAVVTAVPGRLFWESGTPGGRSYLEDQKIPAPA